MTLRHAAAVTGSALLVFGLLTTAVLLALRPHPTENVSLIGAVLTKDSDPAKQMAVPNAQITGTSGSAAGEATSDSSGFFHLTLHGDIRPGRPIQLTFRRRDYKPLSMTTKSPDELQIARMEPIQVEHPTQVAGPQTTISNVKLRYTVKVISTVDQGTLVGQFQAINQGGVPCNEARPCSPDGHWKAASGALTLDASLGGQFRDVRVSCIAGPCPFTKIDPEVRSNDDRTVHVSATTWSDTATFLVEADVVHTQVSDLVRQSIPVLLGRGMSFTLPAGAVGPSIEADVNGPLRMQLVGGSDSYIVFPLGPVLNLSWATCTVTVDPDHSKLYSCELKPGYTFPPSGGK